jgi:hypothetical protein
VRKSTQTNKYATACFVQEAPVSTEINRGDLQILKSTNGFPYCKFPATLQTYGTANRMRRSYCGNNVAQVIAADERIQTLKRQNKWRGEWNHPNPEIKGQVFSDIRMTIPEPIRTSHFINNDRLDNNKYVGMITTHPETDCGKAVNSEIIDLGSVVSFSVRLLGMMIPNMPVGQPNMRVNKVITFDMVDFPSHPNADGHFRAVQESAVEEVVFLKEFAQYLAGKDEIARVVMESFEISMDEITSITEGGLIIVDQPDTSQVRIPLQSELRTEALGLLMKRRG